MYSILNRDWSASRFGQLHLQSGPQSCTGCDSNEEHPRVLAFNPVAISLLVELKWPIYRIKTGKNI
jgi:hypothetical protein